MLAKVVSFGLKGVDGYKIDIETDVSNGLPHFEIVGLADTAIKEAKERVRSAIKNSAFEYPIKRITVNLAPADMKKEGRFMTLALPLPFFLATKKTASKMKGILPIWASFLLTAQSKKSKGFCLF